MNLSTRILIVVLFQVTSLQLVRADTPSRPPSRRADQKPNFVYLLIDDMGYSDCGFNGGTDVQTPNIDALAKRGVNLKSLYAQPVCSPTRAALLTGRLAIHTGVYTVILPGSPAGLPTGERTLPSALRDAGYSTAICGKWHLGESDPKFLPMQRGFDHQYGHYLGNLDYFTHIRSGGLDWYRHQVPLEESGYTTDLIADEACRVIADQPRDKPLFLYVPFNAIHSPLQVPEDCKRQYADLPEPRRTVAGMIASLDNAIGRIDQALEKKGIRDNTLIVFSSDNGGSQPGKRTMNRPLRGGKGSIYEGGIRVCGFAVWDGHLPAATECNQPLHLVDWYPTFLRLAGATTDQPLPIDGRDIWPVLAEGADSPHDALLIPGMSPETAALRMGPWKLLVHANRGNGKQPPRMELYNLANDLAEEHDLAETHPQKIAAMHHQLQQMIQNAAADNGGMTSPTHNRRGQRKNQIDQTP